MAYMQNIAVVHEEVCRVGSHIESLQVRGVDPVGRSIWVCRSPAVSVMLVYGFHTCHADDTVPEL